FGIHASWLRRGCVQLAGRSQLDSVEHGLQPQCLGRAHQDIGRAEQGHAQPVFAVERLQRLERDLGPNPVRVADRKRDPAYHNGSANSVCVTGLSHTATRCASSSLPPASTNLSRTSLVANSMVSPVAMIRATMNGVRAWALAASADSRSGTFSKCR